MSGRGPESLSANSFGQHNSTRAGGSCAYLYPGNEPTAPTMQATNDDAHAVINTTSSLTRRFSTRPRACAADRPDLAAKSASPNKLNTKVVD